MDTRTKQDLKASGIGSFALWSSAPDGRVVVFVHGFGGGASSTWKEFDTRLPKHPKANGADLLFYGYNAARSPIVLSAHLCYEFLDAIATNPQRLALPPIRRRASPTRNITIVAHSMGAIVARKALLLALKARKSWVSRVNLVMFAPAHAGVRVAEIVKECGDLFTKIAILSGIGRGALPGYDDLSDLSTFSDLAAETKAVLSTPEGAAFLAKRVVFGATETVVTVKTFCSDPYTPDPNFKVVHGKGHTSVCKPTSAYPLPVEVVASVL